MLTLEWQDKTGRVDAKALEALRKKGAGVLEAAKGRPAQYSGSLGWLDIEQWAGENTLREIEQVAARVRESCEVFVLIGVGGSNNAARAAIEALADGTGPEIVYAGNTLSPHAMRKVLRRLEGKDFCVNCIAKNFETLEPGASFRVLRRALTERYGNEANGRIITTGTPGSHLEALSRERGYTFLAFPPDIGGRFTALSSVGLLPMAVAGLDIRALVQGAKDMRAELFAAGPEQNPALQYACLRNALYQSGYSLELLASFEPQLRWFYKWWIQLFAESEGKDGKGLFPITAEYSEELHAVGQYVQDGAPLMFETFLDIATQQASLVLQPDDVDDGFGYLDGKDFWQVNRAAFEATRTAHSEKLPIITLTVGALDEAHFGAMFYFFQFACMLSGMLLGINPFDQPGVEAYKGWMFKALGK